MQSSSVSKLFDVTVDELVYISKRLIEFYEYENLSERTEGTEQIFGSLICRSLYDRDKIPYKIK